MIAGLPPHARFTVRRRMEEEKGEKSNDLAGGGGEEFEEAVRFNELRRFSDPLHEELALMVNGLWRLYEAVPSWEKNKRPDMPTLGPREWQPKEDKKTTRLQQKKQKGEDIDVFDAMSVFGYMAGRDSE